VHRELRRPGVTLQLSWEEYPEVHPDGYGYSRYCDLYRSWEQRLSPTMRHADWTPERIRRQAGEIGRNTAALVEIVMRERLHSEQGFAPRSA
jgi:hypothetical protein